MEIRPQIEKTGDGSDTLRHPSTGETYHSSRGALGESQHVFIRNGLATVNCDAVNVLEMGFGTGLNAWLTLEYGRQNGLSIYYTTVELYPVAAETAAELSYTSDPFFMALHTAPWNRSTRITPGFELLKLEGDFATMEFSTIFDIVYFDAFAPDTQPELWRPELFSRLADAINPGGVLVTYSAKGSVKSALRSAGLKVERLAGALGKRHMIRAVKI